MTTENNLKSEFQTCSNNFCSSFVNEPNFYKHACGYILFISASYYKSVSNKI